LHPGPPIKSASGQVEGWEEGGTLTREDVVSKLGENVFVQVELSQNPSPAS